MKILRTRLRRERTALRLPYRIAGRSTDAIDLFFLRLETDEDAVGLGTATPESAVTGETPSACGASLEEESLSWLAGRDVLGIGALCEEARKRMPRSPAALAALDMALHDLFARRLGVPLADALGRVHASLPTSVTIGIQKTEDAMRLAEEIVSRGFRILKVKVGESIDGDIDLIRRLHGRFGGRVRLRADANAGYSSANAVRFLEQTEALGLEFLEQPVPPGNDGLRLLPERWRSHIAADESLLDERDAVALAGAPVAAGIFNVKLMKCGGIRPALRVGAIAGAAAIDLMWGCMDESVIGISAALHAALACPATRYLDLDGSFDLVEDVGRGGFTVTDGEMTVTAAPGLGVFGS